VEIVEHGGRQGDASIEGVGMFSLRIELFLVEIKKIKHLEEKES